MNDLEKQFLTELAGMRQGRCAYDQADYEKALPHLAGLLDGGYIKERRLAIPGRQVLRPGFQLTDKGRAYLGGAND